MSQYLALALGGADNAKQPTYIHVYGDRDYTLHSSAHSGPGTPAHNALHCQVSLASGRSLGRDWRRRPGRPRVRWTDQLRNDTGSVPANLWRQTDRQVILQGHGGGT